MFILRQQKCSIPQSRANINKLKRKKDELFHYIFALRSVSPEGSSGTKGYSLLQDYSKENDVKPLTMNTVLI